MERCVRVPNQKRSIEKKEKILEAAYRIFTEKGYYDTNTAEIAKEAGLSTGSVYSYFKDKKDILLSCLSKFGDELTLQICREIEQAKVTGNVLDTARKVLRVFAEFHNWQKEYHEDIMALQYRDLDVKNYFIKIEKSMMAAIVTQLKKTGLKFQHEREQTFLIFSMVRSIGDKLLVNSDTDIDKDILIDECARIISSMMVKAKDI